MTKMTNGQSRAMDAFKSGRNVFLSGEAGTGKSFVLSKFLESDSVKAKRTLICAPTGIAAINIHGVTLHRAFHIPVMPLGPSDQPDAVSKELLNAEIIVIDEISMCRFDVFQYVAKSILAAQEESGTNKQLIVVGDFFQLPPVITEKDRVALEKLWLTSDVGHGFAFQAPLWESFDFENIILTESMRQINDSAFVNHLNDVRIGKADSLRWINEHCSDIQKSSIFLCPTNREADTINTLCSERVEGNYTSFKAICYGKVLNSDKPTSDILRLKPGLKVMSVINDPGKAFQNGSIGTIQKISSEEKTVTVLFENGRAVSLRPYKWSITEYAIDEEGTLQQKVIGCFIQLPIKIAYAITIHKSQGQTFDSAHINPTCFAFGQLYVALSRLKSVSGLSLSKKILPSYLKVSQEVLSFYKLCSCSTSL